MAAEMSPINPASSASAAVPDGPMGPRKSQPVPSTALARSGAEPTQRQRPDRPDNLAYVINHTVEGPRLTRTYARFDVNDQTRAVTVRIFDASTGKLVRTIPASTLASLADRVKVHHGVLFEYRE